MHGLREIIRLSDLSTASQIRLRKLYGDDVMKGLEEIKAENKAKTRTVENPAYAARKAAETSAYLLIRRLARGMDLFAQGSEVDTHALCKLIDEARQITAVWDANP